MISHFALKGPKWRKTTSVLAQHFVELSWQFSWPPWCQPLSLHFVIYHFWCITTHYGDSTKHQNDFGHIRSILGYLLTNTRLAKGEPCLHKKKYSLDLQVSQAGRHGTWFSAPKTSTSGLVLLVNESSYTETYVKLFFPADFAPLVPKIALKVRPDQLQGSLSPT